jgi:Leucine-rich repeat (LRR) protein
LARCELKEVQGIQAFMQLEELYIAYNDIDELFDIGFLEHLQVLDMEGNNVNSLDQLYYLRRLHHLQEVNFKHNPVTAESGYYQRIQDTVKNISVLDDEVVFPQFFEDKTKAAQRDLLKVAADKDREPSLAELTEEL